MSALERLAAIIRQYGPVPAARLSTAQARGRAKRYQYWGVARYEIALARSGEVISRALERASSDRRSYRLAEHDWNEVCERENRWPTSTIGRLSEDEAAEILANMHRVNGRWIYAPSPELAAHKFGQQFVVPRLVA